MTTIDPKTTALVLIDLQEGIVGMDGLGPHGSDDVVARAKALAGRFRAAGAPVVLVHVAFGAGDAPGLNVDEPSLPKDGTPQGFETLVDGLRQDGDITVLKHHWGAFIGTDLDLQLRRRGTRTIVLAGIATNMGVDSTLRSGWELSYDMIVAEDVCTSRSADLHAFAFENIFPKLARVVRADALTFAG